MADVRYHLPVLERALDIDAEAECAYDPDLHGSNPYRIDRIAHFPPGVRQRPVWVHVLGRLFSEYEALKPRYARHSLTAQILGHKQAVTFPGEWMYSIAFCANKLARRAALRDGENVVLTCIPRKPGGVPRMESLLGQLGRSDELRTLRPKPATFEIRPDVLSYREGVVTAHQMHLDREQRFANVEQHLYVARPDDVRGKVVVVLDDVVTTGASLIVAHRKLLAAGASRVECAALAKAITES